MLAAELKRLETQLMRLRFSEFFKAVFRHVLEPETLLDWGWHLDAICDHVQWVFEEWARKRTNPAHVMRVQNLIVNIPPRCMKSRIISQAAMAWAWLRWPAMTFITLSANPRVAADNARDAYAIVTSEWYRETFDIKWSIQVDRDAVSDFGNTAGGWRKSRGWETKITGEGADCLMPDDPHDAEEAYSDVKREGVVNRWDRAIWNRVRDQRVSIRIGVMQRLHDLDWTGHLLRKMKSDPNAPQWVHLKIPLEYKASKATETDMPCDEFGRLIVEGQDHVGPVMGWRDPRKVDGEIMDPIRFPANLIANLRTSPYVFAGQYNQDPAPAEGGIFKREWWRWWLPEGVRQDILRPRPEGCTERTKDPPRVIPNGGHKGRGGPAFDCVTITIDASFKETEDGSECAILVEGNLGVDRFFMERHTRRMGFNDCLAVIRECEARLRPLYPVLYILIEDKANGSAIIDTLKREFTGVIAVEPEGGKGARAHAMVPAVASGNYYILDGAHWAPELVENFAVFPKGAVDDDIDAASQCHIYHALGVDYHTAMALCSA
jgi:predicted phage terminase large subunit-like protein